MEESPNLQRGASALKVARLLLVFDFAGAAVPCGMSSL
jgi:hypothetical protein